MRRHAARVGMHSAEVGWRTMVKPRNVVGRSGCCSSGDDGLHAMVYISLAVC